MRSTRRRDISRSRSACSSIFWWSASAGKLGATDFRLLQLRLFHFRVWQPLRRRTVSVPSLQCALRYAPRSILRPDLLRQSRADYRAARRCGDRQVADIFSKIPILKDRTFVESKGIALWCPVRKANFDGAASNAVGDN